MAYYSQKFHLFVPLILSFEGVPGENKIISTEGYKNGSQIKINMPRTPKETYKAHQHWVYEAHQQQEARALGDKLNLSFPNGSAGGPESNFMYVLPILLNPTWPSVPCFGRLIPDNVNHDSTSGSLTDT